MLYQVGDVLEVIDAAHFLYGTTFTVLSIEDDSVWLAKGLDNGVETDSPRCYSVGGVDNDFALGSLTVQDAL